MDVLQFISSIIGSIAWPFVVLFLLILLRKQLGGLAVRLDELSLPGGAKAKFREQLESSRESAEELLLESPPIQPVDRQPGGGEAAFMELAKKFPEAAISQTWKQVEEVLLEIRERLPEKQTRQNLNSVVRRLREQGLIDRSAEELFSKLRQVRNTAVHAGSKAGIEPAEAVDYREQVRVLVALFADVLSKMPV